MNSLRRVGRDIGNLTDEELRYVFNVIIGAAWAELHAREIFEVDPIPSVGFRTIRKYTETDMGQALISMEGEAVSLDRTQLTAGTDTKLPVISKDFVINWRDIEAHRDLGESLELREGKNAARQVAEEENKLCLTGEYLGWPALGIEGLASATGRNTAAGGAWPTNAVANINAAIAELETDGFTKGPYVLIGRVAQIRKLDGQVSSTGLTWRKFLLENGILNAIYADDSLYTAATGATTSAIVCVPGKENFALAVAQDISMKTTPLPNMNILTRVYEVVTPHIKRPTSICELTGLS